jgi:hypothetical protein
MLTLYRKKYKSYCLGSLTLPDGLEIFVLERPWLGNKPFVSCVPSGQYIVEPDTTGRFRYYELKDVVDRDEIEIHPANKVEQLEGCLAACMSFNHTTQTSTNSREACDMIFSYFGRTSWVLDIVEVN